MSDSDDEYDPGATKVVVQKTAAPIVSQQQQQNQAHNNNNNNNNNNIINDKRVFGLRAASGIVSSTGPANINFSANLQQASSASSSSLSNISAQNSINDSQLLPLINHFIKSKNILPIFGQDEYSFPSSTASSSLLSQSGGSRGYVYRVQRPGGAIRCVAASGSVLLAGTSLGTSSKASSTSITSCPLFGWDIREIARGAAVAAATSSSLNNNNNSSSSTNNNTSSGSNQASEGLEFRQSGRFLFRTDMFERDRNGIKQQFPAAHLAFIPTSSAQNFSPSYNSISFSLHHGGATSLGSSSNIFAAAAAGSASFKIAKVDKGGEVFGESPTGTAASLNPETFRGHCGTILSLRGYFNTNTNKPQIVTGASDGTVRLWSIETMNEKNDFCVRHGGLSSEGMTFSRSARVIGGAMINNCDGSCDNSNTSNLIWSAGLEDGYVMFWDTRQKFKAGFPSLYLKPPTNASETRIATCLEVPSNTAAALFAVRSLDSIRLHDLRKLSSSSSSSSNNNATLVMPEIKDLRFASPSDAAPMILSNDADASSKNIITTFDSAHESEEYFRDGVAVVSLSSGKVVHRASLFQIPPPGNAVKGNNSNNNSNSNQNNVVSEQPPLIHSLFGISNTGYVGLACSDGVFRFAPVAANAVEKQRKAFLASSGSGVGVDIPWFENIPMMSMLSDTKSGNIGGQRRQRRQGDKNDDESDGDDVQGEE